jgi:hypothetical protein
VRFLRAAERLRATASPSSIPDPVKRMHENVRFHAKGIDKSRRKFWLAMNTT